MANDPSPGFTGAMTVRLVAMRLIDMHRMHPQQIVRECALCGEKVGVYPSGQKALRLCPGPIEIVCAPCAMVTFDPKQDQHRPAAPISEILEEIRASKDVKKS